MTQAIRSFSRSRLRDPLVIEYARETAVEIQMGADEESLVLLPKSDWLAQQELNSLSRLLIATLTSRRMRESVPPALLGDVAFIADWSDEDKEKFCDGFMAALAESLRTGNPGPTSGFLKMMAALDIESPSPKITGDVGTSGSKAGLTRINSRQR